MKKNVIIFISDCELNKYHVSINHLQNFISMYNIYRFYKKYLCLYVIFEYVILSIVNVIVT